MAAPLHAWCPTGLVYAIEHINITHTHTHTDLFSSSIFLFQKHACSPVGPAAHDTGVLYAWGSTGGVTIAGRHETALEETPGPADYVPASPAAGRAAAFGSENRFSSARVHVGGAERLHAVAGAASSSATHTVGGAAGHTSGVGGHAASSAGGHTGGSTTVVKTAWVSGSSGTRGTVTQGASSSSAVTTTIATKSGGVTSAGATTTAGGAATAASTTASGAMTARSVTTTRREAVGAGSGAGSTQGAVTTGAAYAMVPGAISSSRGLVRSTTFSYPTGAHGPPLLVAPAEHTVVQSVTHTRTLPATPTSSTTRSVRTERVKTTATASPTKGSTVVTGTKPSATVGANQAVRTSSAGAHGDVWAEPAVTL